MFSADAILSCPAAPNSHAQAQFWLDVLDKGIKATALILAGIWTAINYFRGRTFAKRLEFQYSGRPFFRNGRGYLIAKISMKNVGLSKVEIRQRGSGGEFMALTSSEQHPSLESDPQRVFSLFKEHQWIESGEEIAQEEIISLDEFPSNVIAVRVTIAIIARRRFHKKGIRWERSYISELPPNRGKNIDTEKGSVR